MFGENPGNPEILKRDVEKFLREKLIFSSKVELVPWGTLPKFEYQAKLVEKTFEK